LIGARFFWSLLQERRLVIFRAMDTTTAMRRVNELVDEYRSRCLWFLREDYYPSTVVEALQVLDYIERHGDREAFRKAASLRQWLSQNSSVSSTRP